MAAGTMADQPLAGRSVLIVEDQFLIAEDMSALVRRLGGQVLGPVSDVAGALAILARDPPQLALLDVNLGEERVYAVVSAAQEAGIPFVFTTGYDATSIDPRFRDAPHLEKPITDHALVGMLQLLPKNMRS